MTNGSPQDLGSTRLYRVVELRRPGCTEVAPRRKRKVVVVCEAVHMRLHIELDDEVLVASTGSQGLVAAAASSAKPSSKPSDTSGRRTYCPPCEVRCATRPTSGTRTLQRGSRRSGEPTRIGWADRSSTFSTLAARGVTLSQADCLIAAAAHRAGAVLATDKPTHFPMSEVQVEHWPVGG